MLPQSSTSFFIQDANCIENLTSFLSVMLVVAHVLSWAMKSFWGGKPVSASCFSCIHLSTSTFHCGYTSEMRMVAALQFFFALPAELRKFFSASRKNFASRVSSLFSSAASGQGALTARPSLPRISFHIFSAQCGHTGQMRMTKLSAHFRTMSLFIGIPLSLHQLRYSFRERHISNQHFCSPSLNCMAAKHISVPRTRRFVSFTSTSSMKFGPPPAPDDRKPSRVSVSRIQFSSLARDTMAASAVSRLKLASSSESPASAHAKRVASAEYFLTVSSIMRKLPLDLDIFSASTNT
mmetsp:Transcript_19015/g.55192  ORF Transcript_19015/g.55192 Transcript_19015/m.55192 type:complete len:294 (-) Transcript_19015:2559-3440(-)